MYIIISPRRILMVGTMVLTFTAGLGIWDKKKPELLQACMKV